MASIRKILIANRGEIAARIARTCKALGIGCATLRHTGEELGPAHHIADEIIEISGTTPVAGYLDIEQIITAAQAARADAIHPGYGFLAENAGLARRADEVGLIFIGPTANVIELMGDKIRARAFVEKHGFPVAPSAIEDDDPASFPSRARKLGFPLLIKPSAGGGGKGMRIVRDAANLDAELATARREGERYFGDGRLFVERYIENPRHIEVQVLGDSHGTVVHFWERECSIQRRFQKIIEETPSPALSPKQRQTICDTAAGIAKAANYSGAGTVEFIYAPSGEFYFLEVNTRLQVEHPITEAVTGFDLVAEQLRIAAGEALGYTQSDIPQTGHAIELRICAEVPDKDFMPAIGKIHLLREPAGPGIRIDSGIRQGQNVTADFDPLLSKLIVHGQTRAQAIGRAAQALRDYVLLGVDTNIAYLERILAHPRFEAGDVSTMFLADEAAKLRTDLTDEDAEQLVAIAALADRDLTRAADDVPLIHALMGGWRN